MKPSIRRKLQHLSLRLAELDHLLSEEHAARDMDGYRKLSRERAELAPVTALYDQYLNAEAEISAASSEQAQGISQINKAVSEVDNVVQQNAAMAQESASASAELNAQARRMEGVVEDLVLVVNGSGNGRIHSGKLPLVMPVRQVAGADDSRDGLREPQSPGKTEALAASPSSLIPLGDENFKDF